MARLLLIEDDRSAVHAMESALRDAGHRVTIAVHAAAAARAIEAGRAEVVVLNAILRGASGFELLARLRGDPASEALPILLVTTLSAPEDRARALHAGADDLLLSPFHPDELVARVHRLLAAADRGASELEGQLGRVSLPELLQLLQSGGTTGTLEVLGELCHGWVQVERGTPIRARFGELAGREAVLAMLDLERGRVRFAAGDPADGSSADRADMSLPNLMFTAAWLTDERSRRPPVLRDHLVRPRHLPTDEVTVPEGFEAVPLARVARCLRDREMVAVRELEREIRSAPGMVRLAVALLVEQGAATTHRAVAPPTDDDLLAAIRSVVGAVRTEDPDAPAVHLLLLADDAVLGGLLELRQRVPRHLLRSPGDSLAAAWRSGRVASLPLGEGPDTVILHLASAADSEPSRGRSLDIYHGVVLWSTDGAAPSRLSPVVDAVEAGAAQGLVVVPDRAAAFRAVATLDGRRRWTSAELHPDSFAPVLQAMARVIAEAAGLHDHGRSAAARQEVAVAAV